MSDPKGSRLPEDWQPSAEDRQFAERCGLNYEKIANEFRDYWISKAGASARKVDWPATWRNWCRKVHPPKPESTLFDAKPHTTPHLTGGVNWKQVGDQIRRLKPVLIREWWRSHPEEVEAYLDGIPTEDRSFARFLLADHVQESAFDAAMKQARGGNGMIVEPDYETLKRRVESILHPFQRSRHMTIPIITPAREIPDAEHPHAAPMQQAIPEGGPEWGNPNGL